MGNIGSKTECATWAFEGSQGQYTIENSYAFRGIIRRIVNQEPRDAMRKGFRLSGLDPEGQKSLDRFNARRKFNAKLQKLRGWARKYGGAAGLMDIRDGRDLSEPVDFGSIQRVGEITIMDRWEFSVRDFQHDLERGEMYRPMEYRLVNLGNVAIHPSRLIVMQGIELTPREMACNEGWGHSIIDAVWKALRDYLTGNSYLAEWVTRSTQGVITMPSLEGAMTGCDVDAIEDRMQTLSMWMSALGDIALTTDESYEVHQRPGAGLVEAAREFFHILVVETEIPMTILGGQTPGGLNTGENAGEWQSWTSYLGGQQVEVFDPAITQWFNVVERAGNSPVEFPDDWAIEWDDLFEPNLTESSTAVVNLATAGTSLIQFGAYSPDEIRNNPVLSKAFPHGETTTSASTEVRDPTAGVDEMDEDEANEALGAA